MAPTLQNTFEIRTQAKKQKDSVLFLSNTTKSYDMTISGFKPDGEYRFCVRAKNVFGNSKWSQYTQYQSPNAELHDVPVVSSRLKVISAHSQAQDANAADHTLKLANNIRYIFCLQIKEQQQQSII